MFVVYKAGQIDQSNQLLKGTCNDTDKEFIGNFVDQRTGLPLLASEAVEGADVAGTAGNAAAGAGAAAEDIAEPPL